MSNPHKSDRLFWQHPFVNIFKQFKIEDWKKSSKEGDVSSVVDKQIKCTVYKIQGSIPAGNFIQFPRTTTQSLGLTGRYLYILFKPIPTKYFVVHVDTVAEEGLVVRISFSNLFKEFKSTSTWLQFPFACHAAKGSVEYYASLGARHDMMGPAPLAQKWTMLVLDLHYILSMYINRKFSHMKNIRLCANVLVKNCFTSDVCYDPRLSVRQARVIGIKSVDQNYAPMPREMNFFLPKDKEWDELYDVVRFPLDDTKSSNQNLHLPYDSMQRLDNSSDDGLFGNRNKDGKKSKPTGLGVIKSPQRDKPRIIDVSRKSGISSSTNKLHISTAHRDQSPKKKKEIVSELPSVGLTLLETTAESCDDPNASLVKTKSGDVHVFAGESSPEREVVVHRHFPGKSTGRQTVVSTEVRSRKSTFRTKGDVSSRSARHETKNESLEKSLNRFTSLEPNPILKLHSVIGFGGSSQNDVHSPSYYRSLAYWLPTCTPSGGNDVVVYAVHAVVVAMETASSRQHFYIGHTDAVTSIAFNNCPAGLSCILASAQGGAGGIVRIWKFETQKCVAIVRSQLASGMSGLAFSQTGAVLVGIGRDGHGKNLVMVWNTSGALRHGSVSVIAKAHTDVEINSIQVCPVDDSRFVSCGRDNIRFWRVRSNQLRSCPVVLPTECKLEEISDVTFAPLGMVSSKNRPETDDANALSVFACSKAGYVIEVDFQKVIIRNMHKLYPSTSSDLTTNEKEKGIALNTLCFSNSFLVTGSVDGVLRLWPLDLSAVFLEVEHEGPIVHLDINRDGVRILAVTSIGTLGYLDVSTRKYTTIMRSHTDIIRDGCLDGLRRTLSTCCDDQTIRVWDVDTLRQLYDFTTPDDSPTCVSVHPSLEIFACGFLSGSVRVFHVGSTTVLSEHVNTGERLMCVMFTRSGERLITADEKGTMTLYDTSNVEHAGAPLLRSLSKAAYPGSHYGPHGIASSYDGRRIAFVGPNEFTITVALSTTLDELLHIDVSTGLKFEPDLLNQRPKIDIPLRLSFTSRKLDQLLVVTKANRLLKLDGKSGKLLSITEDMHRSNTTAVCATDDCRHLVTAGDKLIKVWDYEMSKDISCQAFIGHSSPIHSVMFTPDRLLLITVGGDAVFMWRFLGATSTPREQHSEDVGDKMLVIGKREEEEETDLTEDESSEDLHEECPQPRCPPPEILEAKMDQSSTWIPPETLHTSDLDASDVSEFTIDANLMNKFAHGRTTTPNKNSKEKHRDVADTAQNIKNLRISPKKEDMKASLAEPSDSVPVKVAWTKDPKPDLSIAIPPEQPVEAGFTERPNVLSHFSSLINTSQAAQRTYAAPAGQEGLTLETVIGYNGNGRGNLLWNPETGILAYSCGSTVILENLADNKKNTLRGHLEEVSCMAIQNDGQILASASGGNGLVSSQICLWDTNTHTCRARLKHHEFDVVCLAYSRDDRFLLSVGDYRENAIVVWSAFDGLASPVVLTCTKVSNPVHKVVWNSTTPNEFVSVGGAATINFWLLDEHGVEATLNLHEADIPDEISTDSTNERLVHFTSACFGENRILYVGSNSGVVSAWDTNTNTCVFHWRADSSEITVMKSRGNRMLVAGASRGARLWSLPAVGEARFNNEVKGELALEDELCVNAEIISGAFDDTLDIGIVGTTASTIWYLNWAEHSTVRMVTGHKGKINDIVFDEGQYFATCSDEGTVRLWNVSSLELAVQFQVIDQACCCVTFSHPRDPTSTNSANIPKMIGAGYKDGTLRVFDIDKLILKLKLQPHSSRVTAIQFSYDNKILLSGSSDGVVAATSIATGVTLRVLKDHKGAPINNISCSLRTDHPASLTMRDVTTCEEEPPRLSLICGGDRRVSVWDTEWQHDVCSMIDWLTFPAPCFAPDGTKLPPDNKNSLKMLPPSICRFHPTNRDFLVYCGYGMSKSVEQYSLTQRKVVKSIPLSNWAKCMDISPEGRLFAIGTESRLVEVIDADHGTFQDFTGHHRRVEHLRFSPDGKILLSSAGNELFVWRVNQ